MKDKDYNLDFLAETAIKAAEMAYAPYSNFKVGAALLAEDGRIFTGCNVENSSFGVTNCAERTALFKAVSEGCRKFCSIAIAGGKDEVAAPCGVCRQALSEFCEPSMPVRCVTLDGKIVRDYTLGGLLPASFKL